MIIYNRHWIASLRICREAKRWRAAGIISEEQYGAIKTAHGTPLFVPALWIRIALFIFSSITLGAVIAAFPHWPGADGPIPDAILMAVIGLGTFVALEFLVKRMNLYQSGIEEAMLYNAQGRVIAGLMIVYGTLISGYPQPVVVFLIALPVCVWGAARYHMAIRASSWSGLE